MLELFVSCGKQLIALCFFRNSLISTDATARGIDFGGAKCVISYDAPQFIRTYIHRYFSQRNVGMRHSENSVGESDLFLKAPSFPFGFGEDRRGGLFISSPDAFCI